MAKKTYPKGIYANRSDKAPGFVRSNVKIDNAKAIEFLQAQTTPFTHLTICEGHEPDEYGNLDYICVDDYKMELEAKKAQEGINSARQSAQPASKLQEIPSDQFNNPAKVHADGVKQVQDAITKPSEDFDDIPF